MSEKPESQASPRKPPAVSVVIPTYNYGQFIREAIDSVLAQTYDDFEIIIVDDGSTDDTREVIRPYLSDPRIRCVVQENGGQAKAKNRGAREASAPLVAFLDADDVWLPTKLEKQIPLFEDPEVGVTFTANMLLGPDGVTRLGGERKMYRGWVLDPLFIHNFVPWSSAVARRALYEEVGGMDEELVVAVDYDLWLRAARRCRFDYVDERLVKYRFGHAQITRRKVHLRLETCERIRNRSLRDPEVRRRLRPLTPRRARAHGYKAAGDRSLFAGRRREALKYYWTSLVSLPSFGAAAGALKCLMPTAAYARLRAAKAAWKTPSTESAR